MHLKSNGYQPFELYVWMKDLEGLMWKAQMIYLKMIRFSWC